MREELGVLFALFLIGLGWVAVIAGADCVGRWTHRWIRSVRRGMERKA